MSCADRRSSFNERLGSFLSLLVTLTVNGSKKDTKRRYSSDVDAAFSIALASSFMNLTRSARYNSQHGADAEVSRAKHVWPV